MKKEFLKTLAVFMALAVWLLSGLPPFWQNPQIPPKVPKVEALNKVNNWNFNGDATGWTTTNSTANAATSGNPACGNTTDGTTTNMATFAYNGNLSGQTAFSAVTGTTKNKDYRGNVNQTVVTPGTGTIKAKGKFSYYGNGNFGTGLVSLEIWNSTNTAYVTSLGCATMTSNTAWTTTSFGSDTSLTGGTTYTLRVNLVGKTKSNTTGAITLGVDNIVVNFAPTDLSASAQAGTTNASLSWTASTAGTGANSLHATTPYKVYRDTSPSVSTFLANSTTNTYTDSSTTGNTTYYYAVSDVDTAGDESPLSTEASLLTLPGVPGTPSFSSVTETTLTVSWSAPTGGATSYKIERCSGSGCSNFTEIRTGETGTSYGDSQLTANTLYRYRVRATNATGDGSYSNIGETTTSLVSITITSDGTIAYGTLATAASQNTTVSGLNDTQTAQNDGNVTENFNIKTSNATGGTGWTLGGTIGADIFVHEFSTNGGGNWTAFTTADTYQTLATGISSSGSQNFDLRITTPDPSTDATTKTITITIQAEQQ